jgi:hypothetical protein
MNASLMLLDPIVRHFRGFDSGDRDPRTLFQVS